jgi:hypothetical protein
MDRAALLLEMLDERRLFRDENALAETPSSLPAAS